MLFNNSRTLSLVFSLHFISPLYALNIDNHQIESDGYVRIGAGSSEHGQQQVAFVAPGAPAKYRLGNEADTFVELAADYHYNEHDTDSPTYQGYIMVSAFQPHGNSAELEFDVVQQLYLKMNDVFYGTGDVWVGRRYVDRQDIHINDYFWLNTIQGCQGAVGIEDIEFAGGKIAAVIARADDENVKDLSGLTSTTGVLNTSLLDLRLSTLAITPSVDMSLWVYLARRHSQKILNFDSRNGWGLGGWLSNQTVWGGQLTTGLFLRKGAAIQQSSKGVKPQPVREDQGWNLNSGRSLELIARHTIEKTENYALQTGIIYRKENRGIMGKEGDDLQWISVGARPMFRLNRLSAVAIELGIDWINDDINSQKGSLQKLTTSYEISPHFSFYDRPVIRFFATYARWSDEFKGQVGGAIYEDSSSGWTIGSQLEYWW